MKLCEDREASIAAFREMWRWIAEETLKRKRFVFKHEYFKANPSKQTATNAMCYLCDYARHMKSEHGGIACNYCPINWGAGDCMDGIENHDTAYINWINCFGGFLMMIGKMPLNMPSRFLNCRRRR